MKIYSTYPKGEKIEITDVPQEIGIKAPKMTNKERLEEGLYALLKMAWDAEHDVMSDIITDLLNGYELMEQYRDFAKKGKEDFDEVFNAN